MGKKKGAIGSLCTDHRRLSAVNAEGEDIKKEIADVLEVLEALENTLHIDHKEVLSIKEKKAHNNGAFDKKIYLEYVEDSYE